MCEFTGLRLTPSPVQSSAEIWYIQQELCRRKEAVYSRINAFKMNANAEPLHPTI